jgi:asparagine synthase (glutamine-hydrolysing)
MRRLSIIDIDGGHQPVHNEDRTVWVVFTGEIYNPKRCANCWSDRAIALYRYRYGSHRSHEQYGEACVDKLRGYARLRRLGRAAKSLPWHATGWV